MTPPRKRRKFNRVMREYFCIVCGEKIVSNGNRVLYCANHKAQAEKERNLREKRRSKGLPPEDNPARRFNAEFAPVLRQAVCPCCGRHMTQCRCCEEG